MDNFIVGDKVRQSESNQLAYNWHGTITKVDSAKKEAGVFWEEFKTEEPLIYSFDNLTKY